MYLFWWFAAMVIFGAASLAPAKHKSRLLWLASAMIVGLITRELFAGSASATVAAVAGAAAGAILFTGAEIWRRALA